jgi:preprotein translocase subunit SecE
MNWWTKTRTFLTEVRSELRKVTFPAREEVIGTTIVVIITSVLFAVYLWAADQVITQVYTAINKVFGA